MISFYVCMYVWVCVYVYLYVCMCICVCACVCARVWLLFYDSDVLIESNSNINYTLKFAETTIITFKYINFSTVL